MPYTITVQLDNAIHVQPRYQQTHDGEIDVPALVIALNEGLFSPDKVKRAADIARVVKKYAPAPEPAKADPYSL